MIHKHFCRKLYKLSIVPLANRKFYRVLELLISGFFGSEYEALVYACDSLKHDAKYLVGSYMKVAELLHFCINKKSLITMVKMPQTVTRKVIP